MEVDFETRYGNYYVYNDEVLALIKIWREASQKDKEKILTELVRRLSYMVQARIKGYRNQAIYLDLLQEGKIGLMKAIESFDISRGTNFFKLASWHIGSRIKNYLRWWQRTNRRVNSDNDINYMEAPTPHDFIKKQEEQKVLLKAISCLPKLDRKVVMMRFGVGGHKNHTLKQIGDVFSLSKQQIQNIEFRAITRLSKNHELKVYYRED